MSVRSTIAVAALAALLGCTGARQRPETPTPSTPQAEAAPRAQAAPQEPSPSAAPRTAVARPWPQADSDIPVDPRIHFGALDNGLRFAWARNGEPRERSYLRLHVDVGSLAERDDELGMAHFLEHMAFNGSRHFPAGTLVEWFQEHGMSFGADTNASTQFSQTVYKLDLPRSDEETLREGLQVMRDFADGLLLEPKEVEEEKGVIDGEQRERDSAGFRVFEQQLDRMLAGTLYPERLPIGEAAVRARFDADGVRAFYRRWYRPENMTLVLVGDLGALDPEPLFAASFGDMPVPAEPLLAEPDPGLPDGYSFFFAIPEPEIPSVDVTVEHLEPWREEPNTVAELVADLPLGYARSMLNLRFHELAKRADAPFLGAGVGSGEAFDVFDGESLSVTCAPERWREALAFCEQELRRAVEYGFDQAELDELRADSLRGLDEAVEREPTASSRGLVGAILAAAEDPVVPTDAATRRAIVRPALAALTVEDCQRALREAWSEGELSIYATGSIDLGDDAGAELLRVWNESAAVPVEPRAEETAAAFAYASDPARAGAVAERTHVEDLDFEQVRFENGVALDVKRTDFKQKQVLVGVRLGEGRLTLDPQDAVLEWVAARVFNGGGLVAHSEDELRRLTAGKDVGVGFSIGADRFQLSGATTAEDLLLECELMCAYLTAPGWRDEGLIQLRRQLPLVFEGLEHQPQGPVVTQFLPALYSGDPRFSFPTREQAERPGMDEVRAWLAPQLAEAPIEVSIVGDLDVDQTVAIAAHTFGTLPARRELRRYEEHRVAPAAKSGIDQVHAIDTQVPKSLVMIVFPATDGMDPEVRRRFNVLETVINDRLRVEVREKLGAAYSPGCGIDLSSALPGVGMIVIQAMSDPDKVDTLLAACFEVTDSLAADGVSDEEADRLREPILNGLRDAKRRNGYWMGVLSDAQLDPEHLDEVRSAEAFYRDYSAQDITPLAREYLGRERASTLVVEPQAHAD